MNDDIARLVTVAASTRTFTQDQAELDRLVKEIDRRATISRRSFLKGGVTAVAAGAVMGSVGLNVEAALWIPKEKTLYIPPLEESADILRMIWKCLEEGMFTYGRVYSFDGSHRRISPADSGNLPLYPISLLSKPAYMR